MRLKTVQIERFRSLKDVTVEFSPQTALIGGNGTGKSSILRALDLFFDSSPVVTDEDFFGHDTNFDIEISVVFDDLTDDERDVFGRNIDGDELRVVRVFWSGGGRDNGKYYTFSRQHKPFADVRAIDGRTDRRSAYNRLRESQPEFYSTLSNVTNADQIEENFLEWETNNPAELSWERGGGFVGWRNVAQGRLTRETKLVFIPAVRDAADDVAGARNSPISQLLQIVVQNEIMKRPDIREFEQEIQTRMTEILAPDNLTELGGLATNITETLKQYYEDSEVLLNWEESAPFSLAFPAARMQIQDDQMKLPVPMTGHGLQRALILTLLQHLAGAAFEIEEDTGANSGDVADEEKDEARLGGLILVVEEPELYQHPSKQRHFARVLSELSSGALQSVAETTQIVFATHSPLFISMDRFNEIRLVRRTAPGEEPRETSVQTADLSQIAGSLEAAWDKPAGSFTGPSLIPRLHTFHPEVCEGFFAEVVVLVEGPSDVAALQAVAEFNGLNVLARGVHIIPVGGKTNLGKPFAVFTSLGIPTYMVWDTDNGDEETNIALQKLVGVDDADIVGEPAGVYSNWAAFERKLEMTLQSELGETLYTELLGETCNEFGIESPNDGRKMPAVVKEIIKGAADRGQRSASLESIVAAIQTLRDG